jgi:hypothetical protein
LAMLGKAKKSKVALEHYPTVTRSGAVNILPLCQSRSSQCMYRMNIYPTIRYSYVVERHGEEYRSIYTPRSCVCLWFKEDIYNRCDFEPPKTFYSDNLGTSHSLNFSFFMHKYNYNFYLEDSCEDPTQWYMEALWCLLGVRCVCYRR